jgi:hypothetical protein
MILKLQSPFCIDEEVIDEDLVSVGLALPEAGQARGFAGRDPNDGHSRTV